MGSGIFLLPSRYLRPVSQRRYDLSQREERLIDINRFFRCEPRVPSLRVPLTPRQIDQLQFRRHHVVNVGVVDNLDREAENSV